jgi:SAM-dependent methyltransferase
MRTILRLAVVTALIPAGLSAQPSADALFAGLAVKDGAHVCEIGAGDGALSLAAARLVGASGRVFTSELGETRLAALRGKVTGIANITIVAGDVTRTNFADGSCEAIFLRDVYHHFSEPAAMNASIAKSLKPGGRVGIVDFTPPPGSKAPTPADRGKDGMHGISPEELAKEMNDAGFEVVASEIGNRWFMLVFARKQ